MLEPNTPEAIRWLRYWFPEPWPVTLHAAHVHPETGKKVSIKTGDRANAPLRFSQDGS